MHQSVLDVFEPCDGILAGDIAVAGVEVDADGRRIDQCEDAVKPGGRLGVLLVRFQSDEDAARLGHGGRFMQGVAHQHMIVVGRRPGLLGPFVGIDHRGVALGGKTNRLLQVFRADLGLA